MPALENWAHLDAFVGGVADLMAYPTTVNAYRQISARDNAHLNYWAGRLTALWITQMDDFQQEEVLRRYTRERLGR